MNRDTSIPCYAEVFDWPTKPTHPVRIKSHGRYRDGGPRGGTFYVDLEDAKGNIAPFFFDCFLGRLCFGSGYETAPDAAFLRPGSTIEAEAFAIIDQLAISSPEYADVLECLTHARNWIK
jgi:hypothetical protein